MTVPTLEELKNERPFLTLGQVLSANRSTNGRKRKGHVRQGSGSHGMMRLLNFWIVGAVGHQREIVEQPA